MLYRAFSLNNHYLEFPLNVDDLNVKQRRRQKRTYKFRKLSMELRNRAEHIGFQRSASEDTTARRYKMTEIYLPTGKKWNRRAKSEECRQLWRVKVDKIRCGLEWSEQPWPFVLSSLPVATPWISCLSDCLQVLLTHSLLRSAFSVCFNSVPTFSSQRHHPPQTKS